MRVYDPGVGRFLSVDPIANEYPELTPYQFAGNTPIWATDLDGLEPNYNTSKPSDGLSSPQDNLRSFNLVEQAQFANQKINKIASFEKASYIVQSGDNVSNISKDLHVSITQLMDENHLGKDGKIFPGQKLSWTKAVSFNPTPGNINSVDDPLTGIPGLIKGFEVGLAKMVIGEEVAAAKGGFGSMMEAGEAARYAKYWESYAPKQISPGTTTMDWLRVSGRTGRMESSRVIYDNYGRQIYRVDFSDHMRPLNHSVPHLHQYQYGPMSSFGKESVFNFFGK